MSFVDTAVSVTTFVGNAAALAVKVGKPALPIAQFIAGFVPGLAPAIQVLSIAEPIIEKIAAGAPIAVKAIEAGRPIFDAIQTAGPKMLPALKDLYAIAVNADPARPETHLIAANVTDDQALAFAGPVLLGRPWTKEETQRWWDRAQGVH